MSESDVLDVDRLAFAILDELKKAELAITPGVEMADTIIATLDANGDTNRRVYFTRIRDGGYVRIP